MRDKLIQVSEAEFEHGMMRCVEALFKAVRPRPNSYLAEAPLTGTLFMPDQDYVPHMREACAAIRAGEHFGQTAPAWCPALPLKWEDCEKLEEGDNPRLSLVGLFASSLRLTEWDYQAHPSFAVFCSGLLAYRHTPAHIRNDAGLRQEFSPRKLKGLCDGQLHWRSPAKIAFDREMQARCAALDAWQAAERNKAQPVSV